MKKKVSFAIVALISYLAILLGVVVKLPHSVHAAGTPQLHQAITHTISVSPTAVDLSNTSQCSYLGLNTYYVTCKFNLSINPIPQKGIQWTSSFSATLCQEGICAPDYDLAVLPKKAIFPAGYSSIQVLIIVNDYCYHGSTNATIVFAIPGSQAKVSYLCTMG